MQQAIQVDGMFYAGPVDPETSLRVVERIIAQNDLILQAFLTPPVAGTGGQSSSPHAMDYNLVFIDGSNCVIHADEMVVREGNLEFRREGRTVSLASLASLRTCALMGSISERQNLRSRPPHPAAEAAPA